MALRLDDIDLDRDRALVERFQSGDAAAFDELYRRYFSRLRRYCEKRVGDPHEAEEVAQEAFVRALRAMPGFAGDRRFYPWMTVIASRLCVDTHRRRARTTPEAEVDPGSVEGGQERIVAAVDTELLRQALERLGPRHREVLHFRETEGWSYQHIADHYGVSMGTVEALLFRARKALRREFITVSGRDSGFLGSLPLLGWLVHRLAGLRARLEASNAGSLVPIAVNMSAAAVAIGSAAVLIPHHDGSARVTTTVPAAVAPAAPAGEPLTEVASAARANGSATVSTVAVAPVSSPAPAAAPRPPDPPRRHIPATVDFHDDGSSFSNQAPVSHDDGHLVVGADPQEL